MHIPLLGKMKNPFPFVLTLLGVGVLVVGGMTYRLVMNPKTSIDLEKLTVPAVSENLKVEIKASGTVQPVQTVNISPKTPGRLLQLFVEQGDVVVRGQRLAVMDNRDIYAEGMQAQARFDETIARYRELQAQIPTEIRQLESEVNQAQSRIAQARSQLAIAQDRLREAQARIPRSIDQVRAQLKSAESKLKLAENRVKRNQDLIEEGVISQDRFDEVSNDYLNAKANLIESLGKLDQTQETASPEIGQIQQQIEQLKSAIEESQLALEGKVASLDQRQFTAKSSLNSLKAVAAAAQADLERVKIQYQDTIITAPFPGTITQKFATPGAFVTPTTSASSTASATSTSILSLARGLEVVAKVPEVDIPTLKIGQPAQIIADAYPNAKFAGKVVRIAPEAIVENNVTSFEVTVGLVTGKDELRSKMNVDVTFVGEQLTDALTVPTVSIVSLAGKTGVMVPGVDNQPKFQPVTIGVVVDNKTQILSGLEQGNRVFIDLPDEQNPTNDQDKKE
ncbi:MAG: efflux transporter periplasmic adaptor subunit [Snowella sp.]|jgi:HlyD family secretion protein|nr:MAG: efflux transporter periplasmic adaptor subunit [Snowella sp.]